MFDENPVVTQAVARVLGVFRTHKRGQTVTWERIEAVSGITRLSPEWTALNKRFRRDFLKETGIAVWPVSGVGLRLATHEFQLKDIPRLREQRACRQYNRSIRAVSALPDKELSLYQQIAKAKKLVHLRQVRKAALALIRLKEFHSAPRGGGIPLMTKPKKQESKGEHAQS